MGFSVRVAPGIRVRASSRGLRTSVGPRAARVHFGAGRAGVSTGAGPVSFYSSLGGGSRSRARPPSTGTSSRALAQAAKAEQAQQLAAALRAIMDLHRAEFLPAQPPVAPPPPPPDTRAAHDKHRKAALAGIGLFNRKVRVAAKAAAAAAAEAEIAAIAENDRRLHAEYQAQLDQLWRQLCDNDPETVLGTLAEAFEDNEAAAAPVGVDEAEVSLVVLVPSPASLPERRPATTPAGNLTLKKLTKREAADLYKLMVCGYVLATVKEAFSVAPGLSHARIVALHNTGPDAYGKPQIEAILAAQFARKALDGIQWDRADAHAVVNDASDTLVARFAGPSKEFAALDLNTEPDIARIVHAMDATELVS